MTQVSWKSHRRQGDADPRCGSSPRDTGSSWSTTAHSSIASPAHWDDETREIIDEADDVNDLLRLAFSAWCVPADATVVPLGRYVTLREFERDFEALDASAALRAAIASWVQPPKGAWRIDDEFELKPATRTMLEELWRQAAPLGLTPLDDAGAEQLQRADGGDARTTLAWFGRVLQTPGRSVAFFYESLRAPQQKEPKRNDTLVVVLQDLPCTRVLESSPGGSPQKGPPSRTPP